MAKSKATDRGPRRPWASAPPRYDIQIRTKEGLYKTLAFQTMRPIREWREYANTNPTEAEFIKAIGVSQFVSLDWDNNQRAP
jgi:hypothetical protein